MDAIPKSDIKSVIKSDISFDISIKPTKWIGALRSCDWSDENQQLDLPTFL